MNLKENWEKFNTQIMIRREMRRHIKELEEELINRKETLKILETPKLMKWIKRQKERI